MFQWSFNQRSAAEAAIKEMDRLLEIIGRFPGTWSDDTSLTVATIDSLVRGYDPEDIAKKFIEWLDNGKYSANGYVFDIGSTTRFAILRAKYGDIPAISCGATRSA